MNFSNAIPRAGLPVNREGSALHSPRESSSVIHQWKHAQSVSNQSTALTNSVSQLQRAVARLQGRGNSLSNLTQFKIYQFPTWMRNYHPADEWRRFKVRNGSLFTGATSGPTPIPGTDGAALPDEDAYLSGTNEIAPSDATNFSVSWHEVSVPADGTQYYFWLSLCLPNATETYPTGICFGNDAASAMSMQSGNTVVDPWPSFPYEDPYHFMIGNATAYAVGRAVSLGQVRQEPILFPRAMDLGAFGSFPGITASQMTFRGTYSSSLYYYMGDFVLESDGTYTYQFVLRPTQASAYYYTKGPVLNIDPLTHTPDPWVKICKYTP